MHDRERHLAGGRDPVDTPLPDDDPTRLKIFP